MRPAASVPSRGGRVSAGQRIFASGSQAPTSGDEKHRNAIRRTRVMSTEQKVAVITGASQGIGAGLVKAYRDRNYRVVATARSVKPSNDPDVLAVPGDISDRQTAKRAISEGMARFGRIDTLVNNAGIFVAKPFTKYTESDYAAVLGVNT